MTFCDRTERTTPQSQADVQIVQEQAYALRTKSREAIANVKKFYAEASNSKNCGMRRTESQEFEKAAGSGRQSQGGVGKLPPFEASWRSSKADPPPPLELERLEWEPRTKPSHQPKELSQRIRTARTAGSGGKKRGVFAQMKPLEDNLRAVRLKSASTARIGQTRKASDAHHEAMLKLYKKAESFPRRSARTSRNWTPKVVAGRGTQEFFRSKAKSKAPKPNGKHEKSRKKPSATGSRPRRTPKRPPSGKKPPASPKKPSRDSATAAS